jgi:hypothetical protein
MKSPLCACLCVLKKFKLRFLLDRAVKIRLFVLMTAKSPSLAAGALIRAQYESILVQINSYCFFELVGNMLRKPFEKLLSALYKKTPNLQHEGLNGMNKSGNEFTSVTKRTTAKNQTLTSISSHTFENKVQYD